MMVSDLEVTLVEYTKKFRKRITLWKFDGTVMPVGSKLICISPEDWPEFVTFMAKQGITLTATTYGVKECS